ncbi:TonB-dependent receptor [Fulvivirgaceae bacterium QH1ED-6-2]|nr:TonB-dependent receptor [Parachryseolinea silvisoli]
MQNKYKSLSKKLLKYSAYGIVTQCVVMASVFASEANNGKDIHINAIAISTALPFQGVTVTGTITSSDDGTGLPGVSVLVKGTNRGTTTDADGKFVINVTNGEDILVFSFIGYVQQEVVVGAQTNVDVSLVSDITQLGEVVVVGYGTQQKVTLTGSVAAIKGDEMLRTKNENPQNMLTGRIAGVRVWQKSAEPGSYSANFDIRGMGAPLVVIDGVQRTMEDFQRMNPNDIEDISALKDASAAIYGVRAASGVILVTTKKGSKGKPVISYSGSYTIQTPSNMPKLANAFETMTLYNEQTMRDIDKPSIIYDAADFEAFRNGTRRSTDWNSLIIAKSAPQTQHDLSISGGTDKTQYYIGGGYLYQEGFFKSGDLNYKKFNLRSNITTELTEGLSLNLNLAGFADEQNNPYSSSVDIIRNYWRQGVLFPAYADPENTMLSYEGLDLDENTVAKMTSDVSGYRKYQQKNFQSSISLNFDLATLSSALEGFSAKGLFSYDYRQNNNTAFRREYSLYSTDPATGAYISRVYTASSPNQLQRSMTDRRQWLGQFLLNYNRTFGDHKVVGLLGYESQNRKGDNYFSQRNLAFGIDYLLAGTNEGMVSGMSPNPNDLYEIANAATFGRLNYTYQDRYIAEFQFRYDGSSKFVQDNQWGFFPSGSIGWRISEEPFFQSISALSFVDQLKLRASYGVTADDAQLEYDWYPGYLYPSTNSNFEKGYYNQYAPGNMFGGQFVNAVDLIVPNNQATWWEAQTIDIGIDYEGWNGLFGFSVDYFQRKRTGLLTRLNRDVPTVVGTDAPRENLDSDRQFGMDLEINHRNKIGDLSYKVKAIATITRNKYLFGAANGPYANSYDQWRNDNLNNRYQGVQFGFESAGRYESWEDIWSYPVYKDRNVLPGDYKYEDWNGDGEINDQDQHPYAYDQTPWLNFSMGADFTYKNFDLNFLFQGTAMGSMAYKEPLYAIWGTNGGGTLEQYLDRWHPVDPTADPYNPETQWVSGYYAYTGSPKENSEFNRVSTAYLRLKSIEVGYTLPKLRPNSPLNLRVYANAYNVFTITGVKFVDPEHPDDDLGRLYPLNKTYTLGVSAKF